MKKICYKCKISKPLNDFHKHSTTKDGRQSYCKNCHNARQLEYRIKNAEKIKDYRNKHKQQMSEYRAKNKSQISENNKKYVETNRSKITKYQHDYYLENKEKISRYKKEYYKSAKGKLTKTKARHNRRARESNTNNTLTIQEKNIILFLQNYKCIYPNCTEYFDLSEPTTDHIKPVINGGSLTKDNVQYLCRRHNSKKGIMEKDYRSDIHKDCVLDI